MNKPLPPLDRLLTIFDCDTEAGLLYWRPRSGADQPALAFNTKFAGKVAGWPHSAGYRMVTFTLDGVKHHVLVHRICFAVRHGYEPPFIDHENGVRSDNRDENLRDSGANGNQQNRSKFRAKSGLKGVSANGKGFSARIMVDGRQLYLGTFPDPVAAAKAYDSAALEHHGKFARTNKSMNLIGA